MLRVVHDTNVAVSALIFRAGRLAWLRKACRIVATRMTGSFCVLPTPPGRTRLSRVTRISLRLPLNRVCESLLPAVLRALVEPRPRGFEEPRAVYRVTRSGADCDRIDAQTV